MQSKLLSLGIGLAMLLAPLVSEAAESYRIESEDTIAGFGTDIRVIGEPSTDVTIVIFPPEGPVRTTTRPGGSARPAGGREIVQSERTDARGEATIELTERETEVAGLYEVEIEDSRGRILASGSFEVFADALSLTNSHFEVLSESTEIGEELQGKVVLLDRYDNPLPGRPATVSSSRAKDRILMLDAESDRDGVIRFSFESSEEGTTVLTAIDLLSGDPLEQRMEVQIGEERRERRSGIRASLLDEFESQRNREVPEEVPYGFIDYFQLEIPERHVAVNVPQDVSITARDKNGMVVEDYVGSVRVEVVTDRNARVPIDAVPFLPSHKGTRRLPLAVAFGSAGRHNLRAYDQDDELIEGTLEVLVSGGAREIDLGTIAIESPARESLVSKRELTLSGTAPAFVNLELYDNDELLESSESDSEGKFSFDVFINLSVLQHELVVREGEGGLDRVSEPISITVDTSAPVITDIHVLPDTIVPGGNVTVTATADAGSTVTVSVGEVKEQNMPEVEKPVRTDSQPGRQDDGSSVYEALVTGPLEAGDHSAIVTVRDSAGNESEDSRIIHVLESGLPIVQDLKAEAIEKDILLSWSSVGGVATYRIYFGIDPNSLGNHIDTGANVNSVRLTGLKGGQRYYFAMTAVDSFDRESKEKSLVVSAMTGGSLFQVQLMPEVNGARLLWSSPPGLPLTSYRLRYGVQPGIYNEQRLVDPSQSSYLVQDLINGVLYFMNLSAAQADGKLIIDPVEYTVTPGDSGRAGFHLSAPDPLPTTSTELYQSSLSRQKSFAGIMDSAFASVSASLSKDLDDESDGLLAFLRPQFLPRAGFTPLVFVVLLVLLFSMFITMYFVHRRRYERSLVSSIAAQYQW